MKKTLLIVSSIFFLIGAPLGTYTMFTISTGNFHEVAKGEVYRSAQLDSDQLAAAIKQYGIKSVLNLRGANPSSAWYRDELAVCGRFGVRHFDLPLSAKQDLSVEQTEQIVAILRDAPKPLLIHCKSGADRAAFGAALYHLAIEKKAASEAHRELTMWYGHLPLILHETQGMDRSFWRYVNASDSALAEKN